MGKRRGGKSKRRGGNTESDRNSSQRDVGGGKSKKGSGKTKKMGENKEHLHFRVSVMCQGRVCGVYSSGEEVQRRWCLETWRHRTGDRA